MVSDSRSTIVVKLGLTEPFDTESTQSRNETNRVPNPSAFGLGAQVGVLLPFSRTQEYAADQIGMMYMAEAGYKPEAALDFWQRFATANSGQRSPFSDWLSTHPLDEKRIAHMKELLPAAAAAYERAAVKKAYGSSWK